MKSRGRVTGFLLFFSLCLVAATVACSKPETPEQPAPTTAAPAAQRVAPVTAAPAAAPAAAPMSSGTAIASAQFGANPDLRCDLLEAKRTSGGALLVRWRLVNTGGGQASTGLVAGGASKPIYYNFDWQELYYTDPAENKKYAYLTDSENNKILDVFWGNFNAGEQHLNWAKFPAPPPTSSKITVYIPKFMPFEDVPVTQ